MPFVISVELSYFADRSIVLYLIHSRFQAPVSTRLSRNTAAAASKRTISFLSSIAGVITFNREGLSLLAIAYTAAARTGHFLSEQALARAASIFGSRSAASSLAAA